MAARETGAGRRWRRAAGAVLVLLFVALIALWLERRDLARGYADDLLRQKRVPARYTLAELGLGGQRLTDVVIGDPADPDLTADWVETDTRLGWNGPYVTAIRAGRVRLRGRIVHGKISLGAIDRLLPPPSGAPFAFPDLDLSVADGRARLDTPVGAVGLKLNGSGGLLGGFRGQLAAVAPMLRAGGCAAQRATVFGQVAIRRGEPGFSGPVRLATANCGATRASGIAVTLDATLGAALDRWQGSARPAVAELRGPSLWLKALGGKVDFAGDTRATAGTLALTTGAAAAYGASATGVRVDGHFRYASGISFDGDVAADHASLPARWRQAAAGLRGGGAGTPAGPLLDRLAGALAQAGRDAAVTAKLSFANGAVLVSRADIRAASGAQIGFAGGQGIAAGASGTRIDGGVTLAGGGLPEGRIALTQAAPGAPLVGTARFATYQAGTASLTLTPVTFRATPGGRTAFATRATLSGPLGDGRVEQASLPLTGSWNTGGRLMLNPQCAAVSFRSLRVTGLALDPASLVLCPAGRAIVTFDNGRLGGGARIAAPRLTGVLGGSRITLAAAGSELRFGDGGLQINRLAVRLGAGERVSRLDLAQLTGRIGAGGIAGRYSGGAGQIGAVPLLLSEAAGGWRLRGGVLDLDSALTVSDAAASRRFEPLPARNVTLRLANGAITASGTLSAPDGQAKIADVVIAHRLGDGTGHADLTVPGLTFGPKLQPTALTPLTRGVVADVKGMIAGSGRIDWTPRGVTSSGIFRTDRIDLAAAFGPVSGLKGDLHFTDLLALESAPGQTATVAVINPGVPVENGVIRYRLLQGPKVQVESAVWPFAGGTLALEPTLLDYSRPVEKRLTFTVTGLEAADFLRSFDYKNLAATGTFDGTLPMIFDERGGRIENGTLTARAGGTLAYVGEVSQEDLGTWGNLAFDALKSLKYRQLGLTLNGPLEGEMVTIAKFGGVAQGEGAKSNFLIRRLAKLPFVFNIRIEAPFRGLIDAARGFYDPSYLIQRNLPGLLNQQKQSVQPPASAPVPERKQD